ncbi:hypothetical protein GXM_06439 [Nostoc sphaeroides CCNUC1]|uniref:Uncharacterized protein n=1 Tax=Nostoc sphaeroides CCNUC1 TaxID=2653204 RepID=A0A5P8W861_9NOSO|nr:hypothetical protein GXM_06439 [Nostoc sphaeroides CCNUC1]
MHEKLPVKRSLTVTNPPQILIEYKKLGFKILVNLLSQKVMYFLILNLRAY